jgi:protein-disulfide isomerase
VAAALTVALVGAATACGDASERDALRALSQRADAQEAQLAAMAQRLEAMEAQLSRQGATRAGLAQNVAAAPEGAGAAHDIAVGTSPVRGPADAPVTLVVYSDLQCTFCARAAPLIEALRARHPATLRVVYKHFPLRRHPAARPAAIASEAAHAQGRFWEMHDVLLASQASLEGTDEALRGYARQAGLDLDRFDADRAAHAEAYSARVDADIAQARSVGVRGTPTLFIAGRRVEQRSVPAMSAMIEAALAAAPAKGEAAGAPAPGDASPAPAPVPTGGAR